MLTIYTFIVFILFKLEKANLTLVIYILLFI